MNVKQKKKKRIEKGEKKNEFTQRTLQKRGNILHFSETWNTSHGFSTLLFTLLSIRYLRRPFFLSHFFFFLFNLSRLRKRSIDVITSPRIVTFQSVLFVLNWPIALTTPSFHASLFSFFSLLSLNYLILLDSERTILSLAKLFFFFLSLDLCADSTKRDYVLREKETFAKHDLIVYRSKNQETV